MPPKRKGKKPAKVRTPILIEGFTKEELSKEQMEEHVVRLQDELDREKEERNYFQLERNKLHTCCEITDNELEKLRAEKKNVDKDIEEDEMRYQLEIRVYKQKLKHLLYEHQNTIAELKAHGLVSRQLVQEEQNKLEAELLEDARAIIVDMQEELDYENIVNELELNHNEEMTKTHNSREMQIAETQAKCERKIDLLQQQLDDQRKKVIGEVKDQWTGHINTLMDDHKEAFVKVDEQMVGIDQDIHISMALKAQFEKMEKERGKREKDLVRILQENKHLTERLSKVKEEIAEIERKMKYFKWEEDDSEMVKKKKLDQQKRNYETLEQKFRKARNEADRRSVLLNKKLTGLTDGLEKTNAQLLAMLSASNMDQTALDDIAAYMDSSHYSIKTLEYERAKLFLVRKDLLNFFEVKQRALGVPVEELQLKPKDLGCVPK
ncbi:dynein regulatory complex subunit 4-like isoform X2 [Clinocottus analis]|uniref:dynein regulatory complex subunit 4-like isoform X2 n=1 Tax=Clinocottus analis TaxID=304258 RepID=UPI0035BEB910